jgi:hypothetical protein
MPTYNSNNIIFDNSNHPEQDLFNFLSPVLKDENHCNESCTNLIPTLPIDDTQIQDSLKIAIPPQLISRTLILLEKVTTEKKEAKPIVSNQITLKPQQVKIIQPTTKKLKLRRVVKGFDTFWSKIKEEEIGLILRIPLGFQKERSQTDFRLNNSLGTIMNRMAQIKPF